MVTERITPDRQKLYDAIEKSIFYDNNRQVKPIGADAETLHHENRPLPDYIERRDMLRGTGHKTIKDLVKSRLRGGQNAQTSTYQNGE